MIARGGTSQRANRAHRKQHLNEAGQIAESVARACYGRLLALIAARIRDVAGAEDALSEAFAAALTDWPLRGVPANPQAWLLTVARRKLIDAARRSRTTQAASTHLQLVAEEIAQATTPELPDERLALMFVCAHRAIDAAVRAPLMLQAVLGLDAATIASAFLVAPKTMGQRLARAKARIRLASIPFRLPEREDLAERLQAVLDAIYAAFSSGWTDPGGTEFRRRGLAQEAIFLCRLVVSLLPDEPEALGLLALMLYVDARRAARRNADGEYVPLDEQDVAAWDARLIEQAETLLLRASAMGVVGRFQLEAAVQSAHVVRRQTGRADWAAVVRLYDALEALTGSPVVAINRAVALAEAIGPEAGLAQLDLLADDPRLSEYQPYWAARAGLLARTDALDQASQAYRRAIGMEADPAVRRFLQERLSALR
jgi:RNA polymerase sigma-70 factor (ECF subfamily)